MIEIKAKILLVFCILFWTILFGYVIIDDIKTRSAFPGNIDGDTYTNEFANLSFELPDGWEYVTTEEIEDLLGKSDSNTTYCMMALNAHTGSSVIFLIVDAGIVSDEFFLEMLKYDLNDDSSKFSKVHETFINDDKYFMLEYEWEDDTIQRFYAKKVNDYISNIVVTATKTDENIDNIMSYFK